jgi:hypothetical protein
MLRPFYCWRSSPRYLSDKGLEVLKNQENTPAGTSTPVVWPVAIHFTDIIRPCCIEFSFILFICIMTSWGWKFRLLSVIYFRSSALFYAINVHVGGRNKDWEEGFIFQETVQYSPKLTREQFENVR